MYRVIECFPFMQEPRFDSWTTHPPKNRLKNSVEKICVKKGGKKKES